ncbi:hypothetical protein [uncultured marine virus]|uniref:ATP-dependent helicase Rep n=1 Tax=uncultured marine virus TaxID=186617 RepID=S4TEH1_9VIRU|nr:hypothetical protein [uncultured marine virus]
MSSVEYPEGLAKGTSSKSRARHWIGTWFTIPSLDEFSSMCASNSITTWSAQVEKSPSSGRKHLQFYVRFPKAVRFTKLQQMFPGAHLEVCKDPSACQKYCIKDRTRDGWSHSEGELITSGKRTDLDVACDLVTSRGVSEAALELPSTYVKYHKGLKAYSRELAKEEFPLMKFRDVEVIVLYGTTGSGKTRRAVEESKGDIYPLVSYDPLWFDGYSGQKNLLLDEFYGQLKPYKLLQILDGYYRDWPVKGDYVRGIWDRVYITSNTPPDEWYRTIPAEVYRALMRRVTHVEQVGSRVEEQPLPLNGDDIYSAFVDECFTPCDSDRS